MERLPPLQLNALLSPRYNGPVAQNTSSIDVACGSTSTKCKPVHNKVQQNYEKATHVNKNSDYTTKVISNYTVEIDKWPQLLAANSLSPKLPESCRSREKFLPFQSSLPNANCSTSKPKLLEELEHFLDSELEMFKVDEIGTSQCSLRRLQIFRAVFHQLIEAFSVYAPLLHRIKDEYDTVIFHFQARNFASTGAISRLNTLDEEWKLRLARQELRHLSALKEANDKLKWAQKELAITSSNLAKHLDLETEQARIIEGYEKKLHTAANSNSTLVEALKRSEETLRILHQERQMDSREHHTMCQKLQRAETEINELKRTVAALEQTTNIAKHEDYKQTIEILSEQVRIAHHQVSSNKNNEHSLSQLLYQIMSSMGVELKIEDIRPTKSMSRGINNLSMVVQLPDCDYIDKCDVEWTPEYISFMARELTERLKFAISEKLYKEPSQLSQTFLTEQHGCFEHQKLRTNESLSNLRSTNPGADEKVSRKLSISHVAYLSGDDPYFMICVPTEMQTKGVVRHQFYSLEKVEKYVKQVWGHKDYLERAESSTASKNRVEHISLMQALHLYTVQMNPDEWKATECVYNVVEGLQQFAGASNECYMFKLVLENELPEDIYADYLLDITQLREALFCIDRDRQDMANYIQTHGLQNINNEAEGANKPIDYKTHGVKKNALDDAQGLYNVRVPCSCVLPTEILQTLQSLFPWKSNTSLGNLFRNLIVDLRGELVVNYNALLKTGIPNRKENKFPGFLECFRRQHHTECVEYRSRLEQEIQKAQLRRTKLESNEDRFLLINSDSCQTQDPLMVNHNARQIRTMLSIRELRECWIHIDPSKPHHAINTLLARVSGFTLEQIESHDDILVDESVFRLKLRSIILKPSGKLTN